MVQMTSGRIQRDDYILTPGLSRVDGEGFVRLDQLTPRARAVFLGIVAVDHALHHSYEVDEGAAPEGVRQVVVSDQLYGKETLIINTDGTPDMASRIDAWLLERLGLTSPADAPDSV